MSNKEEKVVEMNVKDNTEEIKGTDFVEPQGKVRKAVKWVLGGIALVVSGVVGGLIGHRIGRGDDDDENESSEEPTTNE